MRPQRFPLLQFACTLLLLRLAPVPTAAGGEDSLGGGTFNLGSVSGGTLGGLGSFGGLPVFIGIGVQVGRYAGMDNNLFTVDDTFSTNFVQVGAAGNRGNALIINGILNIGTGGGVTIAAGSRVGGAGTLTGDLWLRAGAFLEFTPSAPLRVTGKVNLDSSFGAASLLGLGGGTPAGTYPLLRGTATDFAALGLSNWGAAKAYDLGGGKSAWLAQQGSDLQLVVTGPPVLNLSLTDGQLTLDWTTPLSGWILETSSTLTGAWQTVDTAPLKDGDNNTLTLPLSGQRAFYRLRKP
ncbi:MAG: hypothetical protein V4726_13175 [Verrucomicrobiota bacterium]